MKLRLGIIGTNVISDHLCEAADQVPSVELFAVYSRKQETGNAFAARHSIPNVYTDYEAFLDSGLDAVYVASPNGIHHDQTIAALKHGRHVLCEKVMAVNEREVRSMIDCARKNHLILLEAMRPDFDPAYDVIEKNLPRIGRLRRASFEFCQYSSRYDDFRRGTIQNAFNPDLGNAAIMDIGVYCIHTLVRLLGSPDAVSAFSTRLENGFDGSGIVLMDYGTMTAEAVYSKIANSVTPSILQGEDGSILIDYISHPERIVLRLREGSRDGLTGGKEEILSCSAPENNMVCELEKFAELVENRNTDHKYLQYSLDTIRIIDEVRRQNGIKFPGE